MSEPSQNALILNWHKRLGYGTIREIKNSLRDALTSEAPSVTGGPKLMAKSIRPHKVLPDGNIEVQLTKEQVTIVSPEDVDLAELNWYAQQVSGGRHYATRGVPRIYMHRVILERIIGRQLIKDEECDHIDHDPLNNCRNNLRVATHRQNLRNMSTRSDGTSQYRGVSWHKICKRWRAMIWHNGKNEYLGLFDTEEAAYAAYCEKAREYFGEFFNPGTD